MTQAERDRLVALKKAKKKLITQKQAADELGITERHVRRLLRELKRRGDKVVAHGLRGLPSNRRISADTKQEAISILSYPVYRGFGPTLAAEYLAKKHDIDVSRETLRQWMMDAKLWRARRCMNGGRDGAVLASWCSGTPAITTGWRAAAMRCC
jgi:biotin operon repressor